MFSGLEITALGVLAVALILVAIVVGLIFFLKFSFKSKTDLAEKYKGFNWSSPLKARSKYPDVNAFNFRTPFILFGLAASVGLAVAAMSWTTYEKETFIPENALELDEEIEIEPPRTAEPPPPPPPPPPPVIEEVPEEEIEEEEQEDFKDQSVEEEDPYIPPPPPVEDAPPPPPPPPPPPEEDEIFKVVEQMPRFPGCEDKGSEAEKKKCAEEKMVKYLYKHLKYPNIARENGIEGRVFVQFVVEKNGSISDVNVVRDIGGGCGEAAKKVVESMNNMPQKWTPGKQRGRAVKVYFTLPVVFKLQG